MNWLIGAALFAVTLATGTAGAQAIRAPFSVGDYFAPAGWMGDGSRGTIMIKIDENYTGKPRPGDDDGKCMRVSWAPGNSTWAGLYWQSPAGNWGAQPGRPVTGATRVTFWAAGQGGAEVVEFKAGGLRTAGSPHQDSFAATSGQVRLSAGWRQYQINVRGQNLTSVIGAFAWVVRKVNNVGTVTFYLDGIQYE